MVSDYCWYIDKYTVKDRREKMTRNVPIITLDKYLTPTVEIKKKLRQFPTPHSQLIQTRKDFRHHKHSVCRPHYIDSDVESFTEPTWEGNHWRRHHCKSENSKSVSHINAPHICSDLKWKWSYTSKYLKKSRRNDSNIKYSKDTYEALLALLEEEKKKVIEEKNKCVEERNRNFGLQKDIEQLELEIK